MTRTEYDYDTTNNRADNHIKEVLIPPHHSNLEFTTKFGKQVEY